MDSPDEPIFSHQARHLDSKHQQGDRFERAGNSGDGLWTPDWLAPVTKSIGKERMKVDAQINTDDVHWKEQAAALMKEKKIFTAENWDFTYHNDDTVALVREFNYMRSIRPETNQAVFVPRNSS